MRLLELVAGIAEPRLTGANLPGDSLPGDGLPSNNLPSDGLPDIDPEITGISCHSQQVEPGFLFAALPGARQDGLSYCPAALERGARALLVSAEGFTKLPAMRHGVVVLVVQDVRAGYARLAARFFGPPPGFVAMVTGTAGKTSTCWFVAQIWAALGRCPAFVGTTGSWLARDGEWQQLGEPALTTPEPAALHQDLARLRERGADRLIMEASSHGLEQRRLDGLRPDIAAFTQLGRDHLDYHPDMAAYANAKLRLFNELLPRSGIAVLDPDQDGASTVIDHCQRRHVAVFGIIPHPRTAASSCVRLATTRTETGWRLRIGLGGEDEIETELALLGRFQLDNALLAAAITIACGEDSAKVFAALAELSSPPGRLEEITAPPGYGRVFVDYAHKPGALDALLRALRPHCRGRLIVLFGCGGQRDQGKRVLMGEIAARAADYSIITDDNPRAEHAATIRATILAVMADEVAREIGDRALAIATALATLGEHDILVLAGKGHEAVQVVGTETIPFDDRLIAEQALASASDQAIWTSDEVAALDAGGSANFWRTRGVSIDSRTIAPGELFLALSGERFDASQFLPQAFARGAGAAISARIPDDLPSRERALVAYTSSPKLALWRLGEMGRKRAEAAGTTVLAVTGSVGKTTTKTLLGNILRQYHPCYASAGGLNNDIGLPLSLARLPAGQTFAVLEMGMNHRGELARLTRLARPYLALITCIAEAHMEYFEALSDVACAKAEIFLGLAPGGYAILPRDDGQFPILHDKARHAGARIITFGWHEQADIRIEAADIGDGTSSVRCRFGDGSVDFRLGLGGEAMITNAAAVLGVLLALRLPAEPALEAFARARLLPGRGARYWAALPGQGGCVIIDESYNASPLASRAAFAILARAHHPERGEGVRRIVVFGDMLEQGEQGRGMHCALAIELREAGIDIVHGVGRLTRFLLAELPDEQRGHWGERSDVVAERIAAELRDGDIVLVKGSLGMAMRHIIEAIQRIAVAYQPFEEAFPRTVQDVRPYV